MTQRTDPDPAAMPHAADASFNQYDHRMRRAVIIPLLAGVLLTLLIANTPVWTLPLNRLAANSVALLGVVSCGALWFFPWHRYHRNLFLVITVGVSLLIALLMYVGGDAPFDQYFFLIVVFATLFYSLRVSLLVVTLVVLLLLSPLLYTTPDPTFWARTLVYGVTLFVTTWVQNLMLNEVLGKERARRNLEADLAEIRALQNALAQANAQLAEQATTDVLTGVLNHRALLDKLDAHLERAHRHEQSLVVLFFDIDHFKAVNDTYGHQTGDAAITHVARVAQRCLRATDVLGRYGGEEFVAVLPGATIDDALLTGERLRAAVATTPLAHPNGSSVPLTVSVGVAACHGVTCERSDLLQAADAALYAAKRGGRNRVCTGTPVYS